MALTFRYRYVDFGTTFTGDSRLRGDSSRETPGILFANELVTDVGGTCWGANEPLAIIDHHFSGEGQFPSASAAVLHKAKLIRERFGKPPSDVLWLVSHQEPDFDAFCSMYLARWIIESSDGVVDWESYGLHPDGWLDLPQRSEDRLVQSRCNSSASRTALAIAAGELCLRSGRPSASRLPAPASAELRCCSPLSRADAIT